MFLRHSNDRIERCEVFGATVHEATALKSIRPQYDYWQSETDRIRVVVAMVRDRVHSVYRIEDIEAEGTLYSLASSAYQRVLSEAKEQDRRARLYRLVPIQCSATNAPITGWEGRQRTPAVRSDSTFFREIEFTPTSLPPINVEARDWSQTELEIAARSNRLQFPTIVATSTVEAITRQRRGQDVLRRLVLQNYGVQCALCDISDERLLRASHIVGWGEDDQIRGYLSNIICLCTLHDSLFENGYWSLDCNHQLVVQKDIRSRTIQGLISPSCKFRLPREHSPRLDFLSRHCKKHGLRQ